MDGWGMAIAAIGLISYFFTKKRYPSLLFVAGIGMGILIGAVWAYLIVMDIF